MRERVFVDTGGWVAVTVRTDRFHQQAQREWRKLAAGKAFLMVSDYVVAETATFLRYGAGHGAAMGFLGVVDRSLAVGTLDLIRVETGDFAEAKKIFESYDDQDFSFTDCTSFAVAKRLKIPSVFGYDHHFAVMGFTLVG
jgi:predicted nucleic acid-binding protein